MVHSFELKCFSYSHISICMHVHVKLDFWCYYLAWSDSPCLCALWWDLHSCWVVSFSLILFMLTWVSFEDECSSGEILSHLKNWKVELKRKSAENFTKSMNYKSNLRTVASPMGRRKEIVEVELSFGNFKFSKSNLRLHSKSRRNLDEP